MSARSTRAAFGTPPVSAHDARAVANRLIRLALEHRNPLTPMQVLKLVYICHGWMLGLYGRPLIADTIEAWPYGPVVPSVYHALKHHGSNHVLRTIPDADEAFDPEEEDLIEQVFEKYGNYSGIALSEMTHKPRTPWHTTWNRLGRSSVISNDLIEAFYKAKAMAQARLGP